MEQEKSRNQSMLGFLESLIKEYFIADLRSKIYRKKNDKDFWKRTARHKKTKILSITVRNQIPNIFNDDTVHARYYNKFFPLNHIPIIIFTDKDLRSYYWKDTDVTITTEESVLTGRIVHADFEAKDIKVISFDSSLSETYPLEQVRRIL